MSAQNDSKKKFHISLLGNIGCGKSSILKKLKHHESLTVGDEPMEIWENCNGENLLKMYYDDPKKWAFLFQTKVLLTLSEQIKSLHATQNSVIVTVRSPKSSVDIFARALLDKGMISNIELETLKEISDKVEPLCCKENHNHLYVYLRTPPTVIMNNIDKRGQTGDKKITLEDLQLLHEKHEDYVQTLSNKVIIDVEDFSCLDDVIDKMFVKLAPELYMYLHA